jgi:Lrp/AsnC family transcriptional regulator for asnA, asnC and gidA
VKNMHHLDKEDIAILTALQSRARTSYNMISQQTGIPTSTVHDRVKRFIENGTIKGFITLINEEAIGCTQVAIIGVETGAELYSDVAQALTEMEEVVEVYGTTAQYDLMIKIRTYNRPHLGKTLNKIRSIRGVHDINIASIIEAFKEEHTIPIMQEYVKVEK